MKINRFLLLATVLWFSTALEAFAQAKAQDVAYLNDPFYRAIQEQAAKVRDYLIDPKNKCKYVGVLKFRVTKGDMPVSDSAGTLSQAMADRLEVALVLASPDRKPGEKEYPLYILRQASEALARERTEANHLTLSGRKKLFGKIFHVAWAGDDEGEVNANAFVTGEVKFTNDLSKMTISIQVFDRSGELVELVKDVTFDSPLHVLAEVGFSYLLPLLSADNPGPKLQPLKRNPWKEGYVKLRILYDEKVQEVSETGDVVEPGENTKVAFELENTSKDQTFAVVLRVNGQNTLFRETTHGARESKKWILKPNSTRRIEGFQFDDRDAIPFKVESPEESKDGEFRYGPHAGTIHLIGFQGTEVSEDPYAEIVKKREVKQREIAGIAKGFLRNSREEPRSLEALKKKLLALSDKDRDDKESKGYIGAGPGKIDNPVEWKFFKYEFDQPVQESVFHYKRKAK